MLVCDGLCIQLYNIIIIVYRLILRCEIILYISYYIKYYYVF